MEFTPITENRYRQCDWDPSCPPDWRSRCAHSIAAGEESEWPADDQPVREYAEYLQAVAAAKDIVEAAAVNARWPAIAAAHEIAQRDDLHRWELVARLLAGQTNNEIADRCNIPAKVVNWYEALFCNVRPRLRARAYLLHHVVGAGAQRGFRNDEVGAFWCWVAMGGGPLVLDRFVETFYAASQPNEPAAALSVYLRPHVGVDMGLQAVVAGAVLPHFGPSGKVWMRLQLRLEDAAKIDDEERRAFVRQGVRRDLIRAARSFLANKPTLRRQRRPQEARNHDGSAAAAQSSASEGTSLPDGVVSTSSDASTSPEASDTSTRPPRA